MILIVSTSGDLHSRAIVREFHNRNFVDYRVLSSDDISGSRSITIAQKSSSLNVRLGASRGSDSLSLEDIGVVWWRRPNGTQSSFKNRTIQENSYINSECNSASWGILETYFDGKWISAPLATTRAENKIVQLETATKAGFTTPRTLITQSREDVLEFFEECGGEVIVKSLKGIDSPMLFTQKLKAPQDISVEAYSSSPTIYQECILGTRHMRLVCFGDYAYAAIIETEELDWRPDLNVPVYQIEVPATIKRLARSTLDRLGLAMGIFDLKESPSGEWIWLEVNPQGQFLFLEPLTMMPLARLFADYLIETLKTV